MTTEVELRVTADLDQARKEVVGFSKEYAALVGQIEKPLRGVNLARDLERGLEATGKQVAQAKNRLSELQRELINTDQAVYGGSGVGNGVLESEALPWQDQAQSIVMTLPPLATVMLVID